MCGIVSAYTLKIADRLIMIILRSKNIAIIHDERRVWAYAGGTWYEAQPRIDVTTGSWLLTAYEATVSDSEWLSQITANLGKPLGVTWLIENGFPIGVLYAGTQCEQVRMAEVVGILDGIVYNTPWTCEALLALLSRVGSCEAL